MRGLALAGTGTPSVPGTAGMLAPSPGRAGTSGTPIGSSGQGASGTGPVTGVAGTPTVSGAAGTGVAGSPSGAAGRAPAAGGGAVAGMAGAAVAGMTGGVAGAAGMPAAGGGASANAKVTVEFTTVTYGGEYAPLNYGAVWFEDPSKKFIKTAKRWAGMAHAKDLTGWTMASGGWPGAFGGGNAADQMDAVSMATLRTHQKHMVTWSMKNAMMQVVPDGDYVAVLEVTEDRGSKPGPVLRIPFKKAGAPVTVEVPNEKSFTGIVLRYTP